MAWIGIVKAVDIREQHEKVRAHHHGDAGGEPVIVAEADLVGGDRVVLVDHRHRAEPEQGRDRAARVEIAPACFGILMGEQDLRHRHLVAAEHGLIGVGEADLAARGRRLHLFEL